MTTIEAGDLLLTRVLYADALIEPRSVVLHADLDAFSAAGVRPAACGAA